MTVAASGAISLVCTGAPPSCPSPLPIYPHSTTGCAAGQVSITCDAGYLNLDGVIMNGCEASTDTSSCPSTLPTYPHSTTGCTAGQVFITCDAGYLNSDGLIANGCEASTDTSSCPSPLPTYPNSTTQCTQIGGHVFITCNAGFGDADTLIANGCEVDFSSDSNNCGGLGNAIPAPGALHANWACVAGSTTIQSCVSGFFDQNGSSVDGCEFRADPYEPNDGQNTAASAGTGLNPGRSVTVDANLTPGNDDWYRFDTSNCFGLTPQCHVAVDIQAGPGVAGFTVQRDDGVVGSRDTTSSSHTYFIHVIAGAGYVGYTLNIHV
jgi:hypothetical protein